MSSGIIVVVGDKETVNSIEGDSLMDTVAVWLSSGIIVFVRDTETDESIERDSLLDTVAV